MRLALEATGLVKRYGRLVAVDGLDLTVHGGECFGLLGPNGAGKTTTVEMLEGILTPDAGSIRVFGMNWREHEYALREVIGVQLQEAQLEDRLTVIETITLFRSFYRSGLAPEDVLSMVHLDDKRRSWVRNLSGGQRQRLSVACALVADPEILFLDEPTTGLDPQARLQLWDLIAGLKRQGKTIVLTTHYMEEAERLCDRVAIVDHGAVIAMDSPARLIASLGADHVIDIETMSAVDIDAIEALPEVRKVRTEDGAFLLSVEEVHRAVPTVLEELRRQNIALTRLTTHHATLEDVFVALTGRHLRDD